MPSYLNQIPRLTQSMKEFIEITETAAVTYQQTDASGDGKDAGEIRFNLYTTAENYDSALKSRFLAVTRELETEIADRYAKFDKLNFISNHIVEAETLKDIINVHKGEVYHLNFTFVNLASGQKLKAKLVTQGDVQPWLKKTQLYIKKINRYLAELKHNIDTTAQADFQLPQHMIPNANDSSLENPLAWFEYIISKYGLDNLRNYFKPSEDEMDYTDVRYDEASETKTSVDQDPETGEWETTVFKFQDFLLKRLYHEFFKSRELIEKVINLKTTKKDIKLAFVIWLSKLTFLKNAVEKEKQFERYEMLPRPLNALIKYLYDKYPGFCPKPNHATKLFLEKSGNQKLKEPEIRVLSQSSHPGVFRWMKGDPIKNSLLLHEKLNKEFIEDIDLDEFHKLFSGGFPDGLSIRWIDRTINNLHVNKATLLYLFKRLSEAQLIDITFEEPELLLKLAFVFRDADGKTLENLKQSKHGLAIAKKPQTYMKKQIDDIINVLLS